MGFYGKQHVFCRNCGVKMYVSLCGPYRAHVCGQECWRELEMKQTKSIMGTDAPLEEEVETDTFVGP